MKKQFASMRGQTRGKRNGILQTAFQIAVCLFLSIFVLCLCSCTDGAGGGKKKANILAYTERDAEFDMVIQSELDEELRLRAVRTGDDITLTALSPSEIAGLVVKYDMASESAAICISDESNAVSDFESCEKIQISSKASSGLAAVFRLVYPEGTPELRKSDDGTKTEAVFSDGILVIGENSLPAAVKCPYVGSAAPSRVILIEGYEEK